MATINFSTGEHVNYRGDDAVVLGNRFASHTLTLRLENGQIVVVDKNDLFGMNKSLKSVSDDIQRRVDNLNEDIEQGTQKIKYNQKLWYAAVESIRNCRREMNSMLKTLGVKSEKEITDVNDRKKYEELADNKSSETTIRNRASSDVIYYAHRTESDILTRHKYQLQQSLVENFA